MLITILSLYTKLPCLDEWRLLLFCAVFISSDCHSFPGCCVKPCISLCWRKQLWKPCRPQLSLQVEGHAIEMLTNKHGRMWSFLAGALLTPEAPCIFPIFFYKKDQMFVSNNWNMTVVKRDNERSFRRFKRGDIRNKENIVFLRFVRMFGFELGNNIFIKNFI